MDLVIQSSKNETVALTCRMHLHTVNPALSMKDSCLLKFNFIESNVEERSKDNFSGEEK
jgi:hypothetical protein